MVSSDGVSWPHRDAAFAADVGAGVDRRQSDRFSDRRPQTDSFSDRRQQADSFSDRRSQTDRFSDRRQSNEFEDTEAVPEGQ